MIGRLVIMAIILVVAAGGGGFAAGKWLDGSQCLSVAPAAATDPFAAREEQRKRDIDAVLRANPDFHK